MHNQEASGLTGSSPIGDEADVIVVAPYNAFEERRKRGQGPVDPPAPPDDVLLLDPADDVLTFGDFAIEPGFHWFGVALFFLVLVYIPIVSVAICNACTVRKAIDRHRAGERVAFRIDRDRTQKDVSVPVQEADNQPRVGILLRDLGPVEAASQVTTILSRRDVFCAVDLAGNEAGVPADALHIERFTW